MKLPFLKENDRWPVMKEPREQIANPSHDTQLQEHLAEEILMARETKDHRRLREALQALIMHLRSEESDAAMAG